MPRCITCDYCSETDDPRTVTFNWSDNDHGYTCTDCGERIAEANFYSSDDIESGVDLLEPEDILGPDEVLDQRRVGQGTGET